MFMCVCVCVCVLECLCVCVIVFMCAFEECKVEDWTCICVCVCRRGGVRGSYRKGNLNGSVLSINSLYKISTCEM